MSDSELRMFFTVTAGRSGQASLTDLLNQHVPGCLAYFEEPQVHTNLPGILGSYERRFRRRFTATHELLGRGKVLSAFAAGDERSLEKFAEARLRWIQRRMNAAKVCMYFDVSKYFARGMHKAVMKQVPEAGLILLVRDPLLNMRSFLNRNKNFYLDNGRPDGVHNELQLDADDLTVGELYLWAWCEMYLRFDALVERSNPSVWAEIRTDDLRDPQKMTAHLAVLGVSHNEIESADTLNTNASQGFGGTSVAVEDVETFLRFMDRLPNAVRDRIRYLDGYDPARKFAEATAS